MAHIDELGLTSFDHPDVRKQREFLRGTTPMQWKWARDFAAGAAEHPDGVRAHAGGGVLVSRRCPVCRKAPIHARQDVCSARCRAARSRQRKAEARRTRDAQILALLEAALRELRGDP